MDPLRDIKPSRVVSKSFKPKWNFIKGLLGKMSPAASRLQSTKFPCPKRSPLSFAGSAYVAVSHMQTSIEDMDLTFDMATLKVWLYEPFPLNGKACTRW